MFFFPGPVYSDKYMKVSVKNVVNLKPTHSSRENI